MTNLTRNLRVSNIDHKSGSSKTVCAGTILNFFGIPQNKYRYTWNGKNNVWPNILRRFGYAVRSRKSRLPKKCTVGKARKVINKLNDPKGTRYIVRVPHHVLLLDDSGNTVIDTDPRIRDKRRVISLIAIFSK